MNVLITGGTGLVGSELGAQLVKKGHKVWIVTRNERSAKKKIKFPAEIIQHDLRRGPMQIPESIEAVIHLAGENVSAERWNEHVKEDILNSRVDSTSNLVRSLTEKTKKFISASAVGFYGDKKDLILDESSTHGNDFLASVCDAWEAEVLKAKNVSGDIAISTVRIGVVLSPKGGALEKMLPPFKMGIGGALGNGKQWMSWIHIDDLVGLFIFLVENNGKGIFNGVSPSPMTNKEFSKTLADVLKRPMLLNVPKIALKALFGEMSEVLVSSQRVLPLKAQSAGFRFKWPTLKPALQDVLKDQ